MAPDELLYTVKRSTTPWATTTHALKVSNYPGGEPIVTDDCLFPHRALFRPRTLESLMTGLFWVDAVVARGGAAPHLLLPYVPGGRQDRLNPSGDLLFTLRSVATEINARHFPSVTVLDPHSDVTPALIDRCKVIRACDVTAYSKGGYAAVVAPDGGAEKRALGVAQRLGVPLLHGWKTRDVTTGKLAGFGLETRGRPQGRVLVVDDICDGGGTFLGLADELDRVGLRADLSVTHGIFSAGTAALLQRYEKIFTTDSVLTDKPGCIVLPAAVCALEAPF